MFSISIIWLKFDKNTNKLKHVQPTNNCVGFFDSGLGGFSVVEFVAKTNPNQTFLYLKDSDNFPYGNKTDKQLKEIGYNCIKQLLIYKPTTICIACNTMCCVLNDLNVNIPIIKINELIVRQVKNTLAKGSKILVICTNATKKSMFYQNALKEYNIKVLATPELVEMVENNTINKTKVIDIICNTSFKYEGIVLGCTHFNYLKEIISNHFKDKVYIFDGLNLLNKFLKQQYLNDIKNICIIYKTYYRKTLILCCIIICG